jgi:hypothetical protein
MLALTEPAGAQREQRSAQIRTNRGKALLFLASFYPSLLEVILEIVQNALDEGASRVWININYKSRHVAVRDNGRGTSIERFNQALASVATANRKERGSLGQFGLGLISPLGKCKQFRFVSCPESRVNGFNEWLFLTDDIVESVEDPHIPIRSRDDLTLASGIPGKTRVDWRSEMTLSGFTEDAVISEIKVNELAAAICDRYGPTMRRNKTIISIDVLNKGGGRQNLPNVTAPAWDGQPLPESEFSHGASGKTIFRLFIAKKTVKGRHGKVLMGVIGDDFRIEFRHFANAVMRRDLLGKETLAALQSGLFEGEILCEKVTLHQNRSAFVDNEALLDLCIAIEEWTEQYGQKYMAEIKEDQQAERLQELGLRSMHVLENMLNDPALAHLLTVIKSFKFGTIGIGHTEPPKSKVKGFTGLTLSTDGKPGFSRDQTGENKDHKVPKKEHKEHTPLVVGGPRGQPRKIVRSSSLGLQFMHDAMEGSRDLWKLDTEQGVLIFNIRHPLWLMCDVKDSTLMRLQECVAIQALTLHGLPEEMRSAQRQAYDQLNNTLVPWMVHGDKMRAEAKVPVTQIDV